MDSSNLINTLSINLSAPSDVVGEQVNESVESIIEESVIPVLERVIDEYGECNDLTIDSIDIDLGRVLLKDIPDDLESMLRQQIESYILDKDLSSFLEDEVSSIQASDVFGYIKEYVSSGQIPWKEEQGSFSPVSLISEFAEELFLDISNPTSSEESRVILDNFIDSLTEVELMQFVQLLEQSSSDISILSSTDKVDLQQAVSIIYSIAAGVLSVRYPSSFNLLQSRKTLWNQYRSAPESSSLDLVEPALLIESEDGVNQSSEDIIDDILFGDSDSNNEADEIKTGSVVNSSVGDRVKQDGMVEEEELSEETLSENIWKAIDGEDKLPSKRIRISDAGLVLLHPFFIHLFRNLSLVKEKESPMPGKGKKADFVSPEARIHAAHLLRELTGYQEPHFYGNMILEKIICGLGVDFVMPTQWSISDEERGEIDSLLDAVKSYWKPLSKSSNQALQQGFIQREGTVEFSDDSWIVRVEPSAMDILMEDVPWELSFILLPWLDSPVIIDWQRG